VSLPRSALRFASSRLLKLIVLGALPAGNQVVAIADAHATQAEAALRVKHEEHPLRAHSRYDIDRARIACAIAELSAASADGVWAHHEKASPKSTAADCKSLRE
jgi:anaerobic glycerol-3-phosphate dehydrogenase